MRIVSPLTWHLDYIARNLSEQSAYELAVDGADFDWLVSRMRREHCPQWCGLVDGLPMAWFGAAWAPGATSALTLFLYTREGERRWLSLTRLAKRGILETFAAGCTALYAVSTPLRPRQAADWFRFLGARLAGEWLEGARHRYMWEWKGPCARSAAGRMTPSRNSGAS